MEIWKIENGKISKNWKYGKFEKGEIGKMEKLENVKDDNRNKRGSIVGKGEGSDVKTRKCIQWK